jgi:hypothetical protein
MSNHANNQYLEVFVIDKNDINEKTLVPMFDIDSDFSENEDYFRGETIVNDMIESEVCAKEIYEKYKHIKNSLKKLEKMVEMLIGYDNGMQTFLVGNTTYCGDHKTELTEVGDKIVVSIAYVG